MDEINTLVTEFSIQDIILIVIMVASGLKFLWSLFDWFHQKLRRWLSIETEKEKKERNLGDQLQNLADKQEELFKKFDRLSDLNDKIDNITDRLQEDTRSYIIDKHHFFCYKCGCIDLFSLESIERKYMYYKQAGGDSFIDSLMYDIRALPSSPEATVGEGGQ